MDDKEAYQKKLQAQLDEWQANIDKLVAQAREAQADAQVRYNEEIEELRKRRDALESKLHEVQNAQAAAWSDIRAGADKAWDEMSKSMQAAWKRFS